MVVPCLPKMDVYGRDFDVHSCVFLFLFLFYFFSGLYNFEDQYEVKFNNASLGLMSIASRGAERYWSFST